ncbi:hypothetical protein [Bythopirellula goksoeyrii]|nr:hypothetical protein [Bythopirellula goksoeyrii]
MGLSYRANRHVETTSAVDAINYEDPNISSTSRLTEHGSSLDALWEKLTESQIDLTSASAEEDDSNEQEKVELIAKTIGLSAEGELPPNWVVTPPKAIGNVYRQRVASDPFVTEDECFRQLEAEQLPQAVCRRIEQLVSGEAGYPVKVSSPLPLGIGLDFILRDICRDKFTGTVATSVGTMHKVYALLEFNDSVDNELRHAWLNHERRTRLQSFGKYAAILIAALAAVYGLLRVDTWTRGYYSQQLLWGSAIAIIAVAFLLVR